MVVLRTPSSSLSQWPSAIGHCRKRTNERTNERTRKERTTAKQRMTTTHSHSKLPLDERTYSLYSLCRRRRCVVASLRRCVVLSSLRRCVVASSLRRCVVASLRRRCVVVVSLCRVAGDLLLLPALWSVDVCLILRARARGRITAVIVSKHNSTV